MRSGILPIYNQKSSMFLILMLSIIYSTKRRMIIFMILSFLIFYFTLRNVVSLEIILGLIIISFYIIPFAIVLKEQ